MRVEVAGQTREGMVPAIGAVAESVPGPMSSYIVGPCTYTETMALNGYMNMCILWPKLSNWSPIYSL